MLKYITSFFKFLAPIVRKAIIQVAADELSKVAYDRPARRGYIGRRYAPRTSYDHLRPSATRRPAVVNISKAMREARAFDVETGGEFHDVLLVAFDLRGPSAREAHQWLMDNMPSAGTGGDNDEIYLDSWWVANDERFDGTDTDSAVFVNKGDQGAARALLCNQGLAH